MAETTGTQAIDRAAQLLVRVVESTQPPSVGELAERAGLPKSTTSRLVSALERQGLVQRLGDRGRLTAGLTEVSPERKKINVWYTPASGAPVCGRTTQLTRRGGSRNLSLENATCRGGQGQ